MLHDTHFAMARDDASAPMVKSSRIRLSPVPLKLTDQNRINGLICPLLPPREFVKSRPVRKMVGRGGGDRTKSDVESAQLIDFIKQEKR